MLLVGLAVDLCFLTINRFTQVREKVHQYAVLRVLGAAPPFFYLLQLQETILLFVAGTVGGIMLTSLVSIALAHLVPDLLAIETLCGLWPWIGVVPAGAFYAAGVMATDSINGGDLVDALSSKE
jgi:ABC-type antimicrobial peptide transport system permease subunit